MKRLAIGNSGEGAVLFVDDREVRMDITLPGTTPNAVSGCEFRPPIFPID